MMSEDVWAVAVEELEVLFSRAERLFLNHFSRLSKDGDVGYGFALFSKKVRKEKLYVFDGVVLQSDLDGVLKELRCEELLVKIVLVQ